MQRVTALSKEDAENCPVRNVLDRIGDKWSVLVLAVLHTETKRFSEIKREIGDISQRSLTQTLRNLERDGLISRAAYPEIPPRVEYALTEVGRSLLGPLTELIGWALDAHPDIRAARRRFDIDSRK